MTKATLSNPAEALETLRRAGVEFTDDWLADQVADAWRRRAYSALEALAASGESFTADDLLAAVGKPPRPKQVSGAFGSGQRQGLIVPVGAAEGIDGRLVRRWAGADLDLDGEASE